MSLNLRKSAILCRSTVRIGHLWFQRLTRRKQLRIERLTVGVAMTMASLFTDRDGSLEHSTSVLGIEYIFCSHLILNKVRKRS